LSWIIFLMAGLLAFVVGMITMGFYVVRAAGSNPVEAIKYE
jgi:ABC-type antimicrobial peptide transport system permease subunit